MARVRNNQGYRKKVLDIFIRPFLEQENTQERESYLQERETIKPLQDKTWQLASNIVGRFYTPKDVQMAYHLQNKFPNVNTIAKDSCFHFGYMGKPEMEDESDKYISKHFDFRLNGDYDGIDSQDDIDSYRPQSRDFGYAYFRDELKAQDQCNPDITIEMEGKDRNPHEQKFKDANDKYLGTSSGKNNLVSYADQWDKQYELDLIGREYCRDRSIGCEKEEFDQLMVWQVAKSKLIQCHTKWIETILEQCKLLKSVLRDHIYLEQTIELCNKMGITINETDILATTSKGIVVSNADVLSHLETLKNKTQTREQMILARKLYDQQQAN